MGTPQLVAIANSLSDYIGSVSTGNAGYAERGGNEDLLGHNLVNARVLALVNAILNMNVPDLVSQSDMGLETLGIEQGRVTTLLHVQLEDILTELDQILVVLQDDLD